MRWLVCGKAGYALEGFIIAIENGQPADECFEPEVPGYLLYVLARARNSAMEEGEVFGTRSSASMMSRKRCSIAG